MVAFALRNIVWFAIYLCFITAPLFALLFGSLPPARDFWTELSIALDYSGLAIMGLLFAYLRAYGEPDDNISKPGVPYRA